MTIIDQVLTTMRLGRAGDLCACPVCARRVTERATAGACASAPYAHRDCATYRVRQLNRARSPSV
jgi:hypothetical protein